MPSPETLALAAVVISALSFGVSLWAVRYTRAAHLKTIADEMPIFWLTAEPSEREEVHRLTLHARNRGAAHLRVHEIQTIQPESARVINCWDAGAFIDGGWREAPAEALYASDKARCELSVGPAGSEFRSSAGQRSFGEEGWEDFFLHLPPRGGTRGFPWMRSKRSSSIDEISLSIRVIWSLKDERARRRVAQVNMTLTAATRAAAIDR